MVFNFFQVPIDIHIHTLLGDKMAGRERAWKITLYTYTI